MPDNAAQTAAEAAVRAWRTFADRLQVTAPNGSQVSWTDYLKRYYDGRADERTIVGPVAFPAFAEQVLGFAIGQSLAAEVSGVEGRPDFTPADAVTHPFVFEDFFQNAEYRLDVADPAGLSGTFTSSWSWDKRQAVITSLRSARDRASKAREYERNGQIAAAIGQWQIIFGKDWFPAYG